MTGGGLLTGGRLLTGGVGEIFEGAGRGGVEGGRRGDGRGYSFVRGEGIRESYDGPRSRRVEGDVGVGRAIGGGSKSWERGRERIVSLLKGSRCDGCTGRARSEGRS
jgi:hypothetical protein